MNLTSASRCSAAAGYRDRRHHTNTLRVPMSSSVTPIARRLHSTSLASAFPRYVRGRTLKVAADVDPDEIPYIPRPPDWEVMLAPPPRSRWRRVLELNAEEHLKTFNQLLIYRALKLLYGPPDVVSALVNPDRTSALAVDWSFSLTLGDKALCEVRRRHSSRVHLAIWTPRLRNANGRKELGERIVTFCEKLDAFLEQNGHLWDEASDLPAANPQYTATVNVVAEKYRGAERLLAAAKMHDVRPAAAVLPVGSRLEVLSVGYLYAAAAVQYFVALEALVNLLYTLLMRPEFRNRTYQRMTIHSEVDLRLAALHVFCQGFLRQPLTPGSDLWNQVVSLRDFRNDMVHGNVTEEHSIHVLSEDDFMFFYSPSSDFRGRKLEARRQLPRNQARIDAETVERIKATVDQVRVVLLEAMDETTRTWVTSWIDEAFILPRTAGDA